MSQHEYFRLHRVRLEGVLAIFIFAKTTINGYILSGWCSAGGRRRRENRKKYEHLEKKYSPPVTEKSNYLSINLKGFMMWFSRSGSRRCRYGVLMIAGIIASINAQTVDYKTVFSSLLKGRTAKLVWISPQNQIWGMDTKDGIARQITSNTDLPPSTARLHYPSMTWDQTRIIFTNMQNMTLYSVNWDGSGFKKIATGFFCSNAWQGNNKHWAVVAPKSRSLDANNRVLLMNIDNIADTVLLWNKTVVGNGESFHASLSVNGTRMAENYPHPNMGIATVPNGKVNYYQTTGVEICVPTISRDNQYKALCFNYDHTNFIIMDSTGKEVLNKKFSGTGGLPFTAITAPSYLRWTTDQDIATVDDYVVRISDLQYVEVSVSGAKAKAIDVAITGGSPVLMPQLLPRKSDEDMTQIRTSFDIMGRAIRNPSSCGIQISQGNQPELRLVKNDRRMLTIGAR